MLPTDPTIHRDIADLQRRTRTLETMPRERPHFNVRLMGATGDGVTDDYDAIQAAITAAEVAGGIVFFPPGVTYFLNKTSGGGLKLGRDNTGLRAPVVLSGYGATILLSTNVPRFLDFNKVADHDVFRNIIVEGFEIDADLIGGKDHIIIGTLITGTNQTRINVDRLYVRDVRSYNALQDVNTGTNHRLHVHITPFRVAAGTGTDGAENWLTNIRFENVRMEGGNAGITIGGGGISGLGLLIYMDEVHIEGCWHDTGVAPTAFYGSVNYQLCSRAYGRNVSIRNSYGANSGDEGIEINALTYVTLENVLIVNAWNNAYYFNHYSSTEIAGHQHILLRNCHGYTTGITGTSNFCNITAPGVAGASKHGVITVEDCSQYVDHASAWTVSGIGMAALSDVNEINVVRFTQTFVGFDFTSGSAATWVPNSFASATPARVRIRDMAISITGVHSGAGTLTVNTIRPAGGTLALDIEGVSVEIAVSTSLASSLIALQVGNTTGSTVVSGRIARLAVTTTGDTAPRGIIIQRAANLTITDALFIEHCDFSALGGGKEVLFDTGAENKDKVFFRGNVWITFPAIAVAITPGASPYTYTNLDGYKETVTISGGTVTVISLSVDGTNFYTTGLIAGAFVLSNNDALKVTYSVVPTMTKLPHKH